MEEESRWMSVSEAYALPEEAEMPYAYTEIDAIYVWTRGGYQVSRDPDDYPLFIAVEEADQQAWLNFFDDAGVPCSEERQPRDQADRPVQFVLDVRETVEVEFVDERPVVPLSEAVSFAQENRATFERALKMLDEMYELN